MPEQKELDEILKAELKAEPDEIENIVSSSTPQSKTPNDLHLTETYQMKTLLEIATEKLTRLQHYPPEKGKPILAQLIAFLVFNQEAAGDGSELEQTVLALLTRSDKRVHHYLFGWDTEGEQEECITKLLEKATTEDEIYDVMIEDLLMTAIIQWAELESQ